MAVQAELEVSQEQTETPEPEGEVEVVPDEGGQDLPSPEAPGAEGEGEAQEPEAPAPEPPGPGLEDKIARLEAELSELKAKPKEAPPAPQPQITEEQWTAYEEKTGITRAGLTWINSIVAQMKDEIKKEFSGQLGKATFASTLDSMSKSPQYADIHKYKGEIQAYLDDMFPAEHHTNPKVLDAAYFYVKGRSMNKAVSKARNDGERNRRIAGPARPAAPGGGPSTATANRKLTSLEESARKLSGMSVDEYVKYKSRKGR